MAFFPYGWTGLLPGSLGSVPVAVKVFYVSLSVCRTGQRTHSAR